MGASVADGTGSVAVRLQEAVLEFDRAPAAAQPKILELLAREPRAFLIAALRVVWEPGESLARGYLASLLLANGLLVKALCDPYLMSSEQALEVARTAALVEPLLDAKLLRHLVDEAGGGVEGIDRAAAERVLRMIGAISDGARIAPVLAQLLQHPHPRVQSKAASLLGRWNRNPKWTERQLRSADPRVRANAVEALWGLQTEVARAVLLKAAQDPHNRVVGNALVGLDRLGDPTAFPALLHMARHESHVFRATAAWAMGETRDPRFRAVLGNLATRGEGIVRRNVSVALEKIEAAAGA